MSGRQHVLSPKLLDGFEIWYIGFCRTNFILVPVGQM